MYNHSIIVVLGVIPFTSNATDSKTKSPSHKMAVENKVNNN
jgi:hypothetical protein